MGVTGGGSAAAVGEKEFTADDSGVAVSSFTPKSIPSLVAWYDASQIAGQADNTGLTAWADLSGNSHNLSEDGGSNGNPTYYKTTAGKLVNGHPAVWFAGTASSSTTAMSVAVAPTLSMPVTVFVVGEASNFAAAAGAALTGGSHFGGSATASLQVIASSSHWVAYNTGAGVITGPAADANVHLFTAIFNGASSSIQVDSTTTAGTTSSSTPDGLCLGGACGGSNTNSEPSNGPICEVAVYSAAVSAGNITLMQTYLKTKWGTP